MLFKSVQISQTYKRIGTNLLALGLVQVTNVALPLLTFPYLVRVIGIDRYGTVSFALTVMLYFTSITEYGFGMSATREAAINKQDRQKLSELFGVVFGARLLLFAGTVGLLFLMVLVYPRSRTEPLLYLSGCFYVFGNVLMPTWFFQGIERMRYITYLNIIAKVITLLLLFGFIRIADNYRYVILMYGIANTLAGVGALWLITKKEGVRLTVPTFKSVTDKLRDGWDIFSMNLSALLFSSSTIIILGQFVSDTQVGLYSVAEKIAFLVWQLLIVASQAIYPQMCQLAEQSHTDLLRFVRRVGVLLISSIFVVSLGLLMFSEEIVYLITGQIQPELVRLVSVLSFHGFIISLNVPVYQTLLAYGLQVHTARLFNRIVVVNVFVTTVLCWQFGAMGAAAATLVTQVLNTGTMSFLLEFRFSQYSLFRQVTLPG